MLTNKKNNQNYIEVFKLFSNFEFGYLKSSPEYQQPKYDQWYLYFHIDNEVWNGVSFFKWGKKIGITIILCYVMLFLSKILGYIQNIRVKSYDPLCSLLCCVMLSYDFLRKILCYVMLCLWWQELKSKILWYFMLVLFVSKILCSVMNLTVAIMYSISAKTS